MLAVSPLTSVKNERESQIQGFSMEENEFQEFTSGKLLDSIDFDDIFVGISDGDVLPDLEMDQDILADFSVSAGKESEMNLASVAAAKMEDENNSGNSENPVSVSVSDIGLGSSGLIQGEEIVSKREEPARKNPSPNRSEKSRKSSGQSKNPPGKKKPKVDWTPELHRRFVQAVEQLGLDKAVPSRILEIMGINCLTRHNIASHLQKYRSHRKHLLAREAEAASWSQRRRMYGTAAAGGGAGKIEMNPWNAPTMGFPPVPPMPHFRPLHVWGHPSFDQSFLPMWPKHLAPPPPLPHTWPPCQPLPPSPPADPSFWHSHRQYVLTTGTPCFPPHLPPTRFPSPPVAGVPPPVTYKVDTGIGVPAAQTVPQPPSDIHPSKESIDAAIGGVIKMPWLPLPLGLKPPSIDSVITELQRQGISKIPPTSS